MKKIQEMINFDKDGINNALVDIDKILRTKNYD